MNENCYELNSNNMDELTRDNHETILNNLEQGKILYLPGLTFPLQTEDNSLMTDTILDGSHKNVSFNWKTNRLGGHQTADPVLTQQLHDFMKRFAEFAKTLVDTALPFYKNHLIWGRTSYRPAEIQGRSLSKRKDDKRLHVDAFPASPVNGLRILRVFCNINPYGEPRVWHTGEPFPEVLKQFAPSITPYSPFIARLMHLVKITKSLRSAYDHYMLHLHDTMKLNDHYQETVPKNRLDFPPFSTWLVFTDQVSHAALSGQYLLEQTFYLPVEAMGTPELSPLRQLEAYLCRELVV